MQKQLVNDWDIIKTINDGFSNWAYDNPFDTSLLAYKCKTSKQINISLELNKKGHICFSPVEFRRIRKNRHCKAKINKFINIFPNYLFVDTAPDPEHASVLNIKPLYINNNHCCIKLHEIKQFIGWDGTNKNRAKYSIGKNIEISRGAFKFYEGKIINIDSFNAQIELNNNNSINKIQVPVDYLQLTS